MVVNILIEMYNMEHTKQTQTQLHTIAHSPKLQRFLFVYLPCKQYGQTSDMVRIDFGHVF